MGIATKLQKRNLKKINKIKISDMEYIPSIDIYFNLEEAIRAYGFEIDEKDSGACIAYGYHYEHYGEIWVEFNQSFITNTQTDMKVINNYMENYVPQQETLFQGVAPTNQNDFDTLMQLLFPTDTFRSRVEKIPEVKHNIEGEMFESPKPSRPKAQNTITIIDKTEPASARRKRR